MLPQNRELPKALSSFHAKTIGGIDFDNGNLTQNLVIYSKRVICLASLSDV